MVFFHVGKNNSFVNFTQQGHFIMLSDIEQMGFQRKNMQNENYLHKIESMTY